MGKSSLVQSLRVNLLLSLVLFLLDMQLIHMDMVSGAEKNVRLKLSPKLRLLLMRIMATMDILDTMVVDTMDLDTMDTMDMAMDLDIMAKNKQTISKCKYLEITFYPGTESTFHPRGGSTFQILILKRKNDCHQNLTKKLSLPPDYMFKIYKMLNVHCK